MLFVCICSNNSSWFLLLGVWVSRHLRYDRHNSSTLVSIILTATSNLHPSTKTALHGPRAHLPPCPQT